MKLIYDKETDTLYLKLNEGEVVESDEDKPGLILDYDADGNILGIEILNASQKVNQLEEMEYEVA